MANICYNTLEFRLLNVDIYDLLKASLDKEVLFQFLCPLDLGYEDDGKPKLDYYVAMDKWGVRSDVENMQYSYMVTDNTFCLSFDTAWGPPTEFYLSLMDNDDVDFIRATYSEGGMEFLGEYTNDCGTIVNDQYDWDDVIPEALGEEVGLDDYSDEPVFERNGDGDYVRIQEKDETV